MKKVLRWIFRVIFPLCFLRVLCGLFSYEGEVVMFIHNVYFWLKPELSDEDKAKFRDGARSLMTIESVRHGFLGTPASTDRPVIDRSYSASLTVIFDDLAGHDFYQDHPVHDKFRIECADCWTKVLIYDSITNS